MQTLCTIIWLRSIVRRCTASSFFKSRDDLIDPFVMCHNTPMNTFYAVSLVVKLNLRVVLVTKNNNPVRCSIDLQQLKCVCKARSLNTSSLKILTYNCHVAIVYCRFFHVDEKLNHNQTLHRFSDVRFSTVLLGT